MKLLLSWIGSTDIRGYGETGHIIDILKSIEIDKAIFLVGRDKTLEPEWRGGPTKNLQKKYPKLYTITKRINISSCNDYATISAATQSVLLDNCKAEVFINVNSGSKIICGCWMLAADRLPKDSRKPTLLSRDYGRLKYIDI